MKKIFFILALISSGHSFSQSPYLSISLTMDSLLRNFTNYKIEMKFCEPIKKSKRGDWFSHDTSTINFDSLKAIDIACGKYLKNGEGIEALTGENEYKEFNSYKFSNQVFAWENILVFRITNYSSRAWWPPMYIVLPIKYKSFVTIIDLTDVKFESGKVVYLDGTSTKLISGKLYFNYSLKDEKGVETMSFSINKILEE